MKEASGLPLVSARWLARDDADYPQLLGEIYDPPAGLWMLGAIVAADDDAVAVVGSRRASAYGMAVAERLGRELAAAGITVVSGLAIGIDGAAHRGALAGRGRTIAVLGSGIDEIYPPRHRRLASAIAEQGAVISEFAPGTPPFARNFPKRNRVVAGLVRAVVVVEAGENSGSLITARLALESGRDVYGVPGEVGLERTRGVHRLLKQGAGLVEGAEEILQGSFPKRLASRGETGQTRRSIDAPPPDFQRLLASFDATVVPVDRLIETSGLAPARVLEILLDLEMSGRVRRHPGPAYSRVPA